MGSDGPKGYQCTTCGGWIANGAVDLVYVGDQPYHAECAPEDGIEYSPVGEALGAVVLAIMGAACAIVWLAVGCPTHPLQ